MVDNEARSQSGVRPEINLRASNQRPTPWVCLRQIGLFRKSLGPQAPFMGRRFLARTLSQRDAKRVRVDAGVRKSAAVYHLADHYGFYRLTFHHYPNNPGKTNNTSIRASAALPVRWLIMLA